MMSTTLLPVEPAHRLALRPQEQRWLIEDLWADEGVGILGGQPKCGKSFGCISLFAPRFGALQRLSGRKARGSERSISTWGPVPVDNRLVKNQEPTGRDPNVGQYRSSTA